MRIGEFAARAGISTSKIRFYEKRGLLPRSMRQANNYRSYGAADLRIVSFIDDARALGFSLADITRFMQRPPEERRDKRRFVHALETKLAAIGQHLTEVRQQRDRILALLACIETTRR